MIIKYSEEKQNWSSVRQRGNSKQTSWQTCNQWKCTQQCACACAWTQQ